MTAISKRMKQEPQFHQPYGRSLATLEVAHPIIAECAAALKISSGSGLQWQKAQAFLEEI